MTLDDLSSLPPTLSIDRAADILGLGRNLAYAAAKSGEIPTLRFGRRIVVPTARLLEMLGVAEDDSPAPRIVEGPDG